MLKKAVNWGRDRNWYVHEARNVMESEWERGRERVLFFG